MVRSIDIDEVGNDRLGKIELIRIWKSAFRTERWEGHVLFVNEGYDY